MIRILISLSFFLLLSCTVQPAPQPTSSHLENTPSALPTRLDLTTKPDNSTATSHPTSTSHPTRTTTPTPQPSPTHTRTQTPFPPQPTITSWETYTFENGLSFQRPADWQVEVSPSGDAIIFLAQQKQNPLYRFIAGTAVRDNNNRDGVPAGLWEPNEGGYEILWSDWYNLNSIPAFVYIWGPRQDYESPLVNFYLVNPKGQIDFHIWAFISQQDNQTILENDYQALVEEKYGLLFQIAGSAVLPED